jgi:hypothetical protein
MVGISFYSVKVLRMRGEFHSAPTVPLCGTKPQLQLTPGKDVGVDDPQTWDPGTKLLAADWIKWQLSGM